MTRGLGIGMFTYQVDIINPREDGVPTTKLTRELSAAVEEACERAGVDPSRVKVEVIDG